MKHEMATEPREVGSVSGIAIHIRDSASARLEELVDLVQSLLGRLGSPLPAKVLDALEGIVNLVETPDGLLQVVTLELDRGLAGGTREYVAGVQVTESYRKLVGALRTIERLELVGNSHRFLADGASPVPSEPPSCASDQVDQPEVPPGNSRKVGRAR